jgi:hypothetical protein
MDEGLVNAVSEAWIDAEGGDASYRSARVVLRGFADPASWAVLDGPEAVLLWDSRRVMSITADDDDVVVQLRSFPDETSIRWNQGDREPRDYGGGITYHWTFSPPNVASLSVTGWVGDDGRPDQAELFARGLARQLGWPLDDGSG